jgi:hypothetical protein
MATANNGNPQDLQVTETLERKQAGNTCCVILPDGF